MSFYPRHPRGWRHVLAQIERFRIKFLSTPPSRVATIRRTTIFEIDTVVSIHATLAGGDACVSVGDAYFSIVSIHATLAGGDLRVCAPLAHVAGFLSTPPSRVATAALPHGIQNAFVSIHATLAGGDR